MYGVNCKADSTALIGMLIGMATIRMGVCSAVNPSCKEDNDNKRRHQYVFKFTKDFHPSPDSLEIFEV